MHEQQSPYKRVRGSAQWTGLQSRDVPYKADYAATVQQARHQRVQSRYQQQQPGASGQRKPQKQVPPQRQRQQQPAHQRQQYKQNPTNIEQMHHTIHHAFRHQLPPRQNHNEFVEDPTGTVLTPAQIGTPIHTRYQSVQNLSPQNIQQAKQLLRNAGYELPNEAQLHVAPSHSMNTSLVILYLVNFHYFVLYAKQPNTTEKHFKNTKK